MNSLIKVPLEGGKLLFPAYTIPFGISNALKLFSKEFNIPYSSICVNGKTYTIYQKKAKEALLCAQGNIPAEMIGIMLPSKFAVDGWKIVKEGNYKETDLLHEMYWHLGAVMIQPDQQLPFTRTYVLVNELHRFENRDPSQSCSPSKTELPLDGLFFWKYLDEKPSDMTKLMASMVGADYVLQCGSWVFKKRSKNTPSSLFKLLEKFRLLKAPKG